MWFYWILGCYRIWMCIKSLITHQLIDRPHFYYFEVGQCSSLKWLYFYMKYNSSVVSLCWYVNFQNYFIISNSWKYMMISSFDSIFSFIFLSILWLLLLSSDETYQLFYIHIRRVVYDGFTLFNFIWIFCYYSSFCILALTYPILEVLCYKS